MVILTALLTRSLWSFVPRQPGDRTLRIVAWMRLVCVGPLLSGFALATLPRFVGGDYSLIASLIILAGWNVYLVIWRWSDTRQGTQGKSRIRIISIFTIYPTIFFAPPLPLTEIVFPPAPMRVYALKTLCLHDCARTHTYLAPLGV